MERADLLELIESHLSRIKWNGLDSRQILKVCKVLEEVLEEEGRKALIGTRSKDSETRSEE